MNSTMCFAEDKKQPTYYVSITIDAFFLSNCIAATSSVHSSDSYGRDRINNPGCIWENLY